MRASWPRPTIRTRLTGAAAGVTLLMFAVASFAITSIQRDALTRGVDEAIRQRADNLAPINTSIRSLPVEGDREDSFLQLLDANGRVQAASNNVADIPAVRVTTRDRRSSRFTTARLARPSGHFRVLVRPVHGGSTELILLVGKNLDDVTESVHILVVTLTIVTPILALLLGTLAWWLTGRTLRPVDAVRKEVQGIHGGELHRRVSVPETNDEIADLARTMNDMLGRVEAASLRQQQFVDDASHELRTPLTRMVTDLEVAIAHPDQETVETLLPRLLDDAADLRELLQDLLYLALASSDRTGRHDETDLDDVALGAAREVRWNSTSPVDTTGISAARVLGNGRELERAVRNLLENAVRHARTRVLISTATDGEFCHVVVDDDGPGVAPTDRKRIFERFTRLDEARARRDGGAGLGLAIVADIAARHHGHVSVTDAPIGGARFVLSIPSAD